MNLVALLLNLTNYMTVYFGTVRGQIQTLTDRLNAHQYDEDNPHGVTADHVGLSQVMNYPPATKEQAIEALDNQSNITPKRLEQFIDANFSTPMVAVLDKAIKDLE